MDLMPMNLRFWKDQFERVFEIITEGNLLDRYSCGDLNIQENQKKGNCKN